MSAYERFNLLDFPLDGGFRVVEAGAGSGKTYNLVRLVLRLVTRDVDPVDIRKILLVTFTDAAALEMRQRLRSILEQALQKKLTGDLAKIMCVGEQARERLCRRRVSRALDNLGSMQVTTIHGFCLRAYGDHGVNAGFSPLPSDPIDGAELAAVIAADWLRQHPGSPYTPGDVAAAAQALFTTPSTALPQALESLRAYVEERVAATPVVTFDHLIVRLRDALVDPVRGPALTAALQADYQACLIDESQDTDPAQWEIFNRLFGPLSGSRRHFLLMVGDPKQSIYGFRGADVNTYVAARSEALKVFTLPDNFRSSPRILAAFNTLFAHRAFFGSGVDIRYEAAQPGKNAAGQCEIAELGAGPFEVIHSNLPADVAREAGRLIRELDAAAINREGKVGLGTPEKPEPRAEVGILVRSNNEAAKVYRALISAGLGASLESQQSVFETTTAFQTQLLLRAVLRPAHAGHRRALLLSRPALFGPAAKLDNDTDNALARWLTAIQTAWLKQGFAAAWERLTRTAPSEALLSVSESLARSHFRNRALMDLSHVGELLIARCRRNHWTPEQVFDHLSARLKLEDGGDDDAESNAAEDECLRSDLPNARVLVRTIHKSKGLEYNAVILAKCFSSRRAGRRKGTVVRRAGGATALYLSAGEDDGDGIVADLDSQLRAEDARLLYVALTRARHRLVWMGTASFEPSSKGKVPEPQGFSAILRDIGLGPLLQAGTLGEVLTPLTAHPGLASEVPAEPDARPAPYRPAVLPAPVVLPRHVGATSYTGLTQGKHEAAGAVPGMDQPVDPPSTPDRLLIPEKLKGNLLGNLLHKLMEVLDFRRALAEPAYLTERVENELTKSALIAPDSPDFRPTVEELCRSFAIWLNQPLRAHSGAAFRLADLDPAEQLAEVRFSFAADVDAASFPRLETAFAEEFGRTEYPELAKLGLGWGRDAPLCGLLTGSVDFVCAHGGQFFIFDWKSNFVGKSGADYLPASLARSIARERYHLQFSIYCLALDAHLRRCLGERWDFARDFGGVYYVYLRGFGFDPAGPGGAFYHRPSAAFLDRLRSVFQPALAR